MSHPHLSAQARTSVQAKAVLLARLKTVQLLKMSEKEIAALIEEAEKDPVFQQLIYPKEGERKVVRFQAHPRTRLSQSFYELNEGTLPQGARPEASSVIAENKDALALIRRMGKENFETHFLRAEKEIDRAGLAHELELSEADIQRVRDFLLTYSIQCEFFDPSEKNLRSPGQHVVRLARISLDEAGEPVFEFGSPLLARGRYQIHYDQFQRMLGGQNLSPKERRHLKAFIRRLELINWRQNTLYRILDILCHAHRAFLATRDKSKQSALTQRQLAKQLALSPSTVNRAIQGRSLVLPWGEEVLLEDLFCSRKSLCVGVLESLSEEGLDFERLTDEDLKKEIMDRVGLNVPRRTVNSYRRCLPSGKP